MSVILTAATLYGLLVFAIIACALMAFGVVWLVERWRAVAVMPRDAGFDLIAKLQSCGLADRPGIDPRDYGDEDPEQDIATEGLGTDRPVPTWHWGRAADGRPFIRRAWPSWTTPLAYLPESEWQLWTSVIAESAR